MNATLGVVETHSLDEIAAAFNAELLRALADRTHVTSGDIRRAACIGYLLPASGVGAEIRYEDDARLAAIGYAGRFLASLGWIPAGTTVGQRLLAEFLADCIVCQAVVHAAVYAHGAHAIYLIGFSTEYEYKYPQTGCLGVTLTCAIALADV
ncbi:MAG: hypothetical protein M0R22_06335 [Dehalococcoidia bacterium]|nr:hypothetical protein [Dehalococcoidia bacterium]